MDDSSRRGPPRQRTSAHEGGAPEWLDSEWCRAVKSRGSRGGERAGGLPVAMERGIGTLIVTLGSRDDGMNGTAHLQGRGDRGGVVVRGRRERRKCRAKWVTGAVGRRGRGSLAHGQEE
jgi:hypothetical protein